MHSWEAFDKAKEIVGILKEKYLQNISEHDQKILRGIIQNILEK